MNDINNDDGGGDSADRQEVQARHIQDEVGRRRTQKFHGGTTFM